ncbi:MAG TPA: hypothetical protein VFT22_01575 [Kofleriaceae bacterium]|nr:hypothetical protein [Kofleriaceae bacterium]
MWKRHRSSLGVGVLILGGFVMGGCGQKVFPRELFTISGEGAEFPVMLSQAPPGTGGAKVIAASGTRELRHWSSSQVGSMTIHSQDVEEMQSEVSASTKLNAQVPRAGRWLQIDRIELESTDLTMYSNTKSGRRLVLEGTVYR